MIAPSSPFDEANLERGLAWLREQGYEPVPGAHARERRRYLAGADEARAADLQAALTDPSIAGVICARGGYGASRVLAHLDARVIAPHCKFFGGFSDITTLHLWLLRQCSWVTFHSPMVGTHWAGKGFDAPTAASLAAALRGAPAPVVAPQALCLRGGRARGRLVGGNLTLLCHSIGTPCEPDTDGAILLVEEVHEAPYRIDRMLTHLRLAGKLSGITGMVVGELDDCAPSADDKATLDAVLADVLGDLPVPIITGFPLSHATPNHTVALGVEYALDVDARRLEPLEPSFS